MKAAILNLEMRKLASLVLIPVFLIIIGVLAALNIPGSLEYPVALALLNTLFLGIIPLFIAYLTFRVVSRSGSASVFLLGCGVLVFGLGSIVAGWVSPLPGGPNMTVTIHNTCACFGSILIFAGAVIRRHVTKTGAGSISTGMVAAAYAGLFVFVGALSLAAIQGLTPPFFVPGSGPTLLRQVILENAVLLFAISSVLFIAGWRRERSDFFFWYSGAFALIAIGLLAVFVQPSVGSLIGWTGRIAQYLGLVYALNAILIARQTAARKGLPLEEVIAGFFTDAEQSYRSLVETATDAIVVSDADSRIIFLNSAAETMFGYSGGTAIGLPFECFIGSDERAGVNASEGGFTFSAGDENATIPREILCRRQDGTTFPAELARSRHEFTGKILTTSIIRDITDRKRAEEGQARLQALMNHNPCLVFLKDASGRYVYLNQTYEVQFALSKDWYGKTDYDFWPRESAELFRANDREVLESGRTHQFIEDSTGPDGKRYVWLNYKFPFTDAQGGLYVGGIGIDITAQQQAEEALRESEEKFRDLFTQMVDGSALHEIVYSAPGEPVDYRILDTNPAFGRILGLKRVEVIGKTSREAYGVDTPPYFDVYRRVAETGRPEEFEVFFAPLNKHFTISAYSPGPGKFATIFADITGRRNAEEALRESEEKYRNLVKYAPAAIYEMDLQGTKFLSVNEVMCDILGYSQDELLGIKPADLLDEESRVLFAQRIRKKLEGDQSLDAAEYRIRRKDGTWIYADINVGSFTFADNKPSRVVVIGHDITERKRMEGELIRKNEDLNALNEELTATQEELHQNIGELSRRELDLGRALKEKEILLSEIHHRVKNNLSAFISLLSLEGSTEDTPAGKLLRQDLQNRARSMALIHETLYRTNLFDEVDMGIYLTNLIDQVTNSFRTTRPVKTTVEAHGIMLDIPRATPAGLIINELVTNSFKYAFPESFDAQTVRHAPPTISISLTKNDGEYVMAVKDNGVGLPPGFDLAKTHSLGLKLVTFLAKHQMRSNIEVKSAEGTEYMFRFRVRPSDETGLNHHPAGSAKGYRG